MFLRTGIKTKISAKIFLSYFCSSMKKKMIIVAITLFLSVVFSKSSTAQCSICTKTAQQLGEKPAKGLNAGIIYLASAPFLIAGYVFYRWKKSDHTN